MTTADEEKRIFRFFSVRLLPEKQEKI